MELFDTTITHRDSCKTYPLRRLGLTKLINWDDDTPTIKDLLESEIFEHVKTPEVGCILIWMHKTVDEYFTPRRITKDGKIVSIGKKLYGHCGVYEADDMVSDVTSSDGYCELRARYYCDVPKPDYILKLKYS